jgi:hypothetical protein
VGVGPLGAFGGYVLMPVMNERGLFWNIAPSGLTRWALLPGNARETWGRDLVADLLVHNLIRSRVLLRMAGVEL